jgi:uncharacterized membrane protein YbhN (UPF0104 family)
MWMVAGMIAVLLTWVAKAMRWRALLGHAAPSLPAIFPFLMMGYFVNTYAPVRAGEIVRAYLLGRRVQQGTVQGLGTIAVEKLFDVLMLLCLLLLLPFAPVSDAVRARTTTVGLAGLAVLVSLAGFRRLGGDGPQSWTLLARLPIVGSARFRTWLDSAWRSLDALREPALFGRVLAWSLAGWVLGAVVNQLGFLALGFDLPFSAVLLLLFAGYVGAAVPQAPGKVGVFHFAVVLALSPYGITGAAALSFSIIFHLMVFGPPTLLALFYLIRWNISLARLAPQES